MKMAQSKFTCCWAYFYVIIVRPARSEIEREAVYEGRAGQHCLFVNKAARSKIEREAVYEERAGQHCLFADFLF